MKQFTLQSVTEALSNRKIEFEFHSSESYQWAVKFYYNDYECIFGRPKSRTGTAYASLSTPTYRGVSDSQQFEHLMREYFQSYGLSTKSEQDSFINQAIRVIDDDEGVEESGFVCRFHAGWWNDDLHEYSSVSELLEEFIQTADWMEQNLYFVGNSLGHTKYTKPDSELGFTAFLDTEAVDLEK